MNDRCSIVCPSVGSIGHLCTCKLPCQISDQSSDCEDGRCWNRCHVRATRRYLKKPPRNLTASWQGVCVLSATPDEEPTTIACGTSRSGAPNPPTVFTSDNGDQMPSMYQ